MTRLAVDPGGSSFVAVVPRDEDRPLFALQRDQGLRWPHEVLIWCNGKVHVVALEVVRHPIDVDKPVSGTVNRSNSAYTFSNPSATSRRSSQLSPTRAGDEPGTDMKITIYGWSIRDLLTGSQPG